jgi:hypothetical protein
VVQDPVGADTLRAHVARYLAIPPVTVSVVIVEALPMTSAGKKDYKAIESLPKGAS